MRPGLQVNLTALYLNPTNPDAKMQQVIVSQQVTPLRDRCGASRPHDAALEPDRLFVSVRTCSDSAVLVLSFQQGYRRDLDTLQVRRPNCTGSRLVENI